jgi:PBSX family phage terminase large subunit
LIIDSNEIFFEKQRAALAALANDTPHTEVLYGGGVGGGKSVVGVGWQIMRRLKYKGSRGLIGRSKLSALKNTTLRSFFETAKRDFKMEAGKHYSVNNQSNIITFFNGSEIFLKDLFLYPSDPDFDSLGSLEITDAFIDEVTQITPKAWSVVKSRMRYMVSDEIKGVILGTCNPAKGWVYNNFYKPYTDGTLPEYRCFIQSLITDNPHLPKSYIESLKTLPEQQRKRLLEGNWDYDDSIDRLFNYDDLTSMFRNDNTGDKKYITADIARFGKDSTVIGVWKGFTLIEIEEMKTSSVDESVRSIKTLMQKHSVNLSNVVVDGDGIGGGVVDYLKCREFVGGSSPLNNKNCKNLRAEGYFKLAEFVESRKIAILVDSKKEDIIRELDSTRRKNPELDGKLQVIGKDQIKAMNAGQSPDYADMIMMRMYFELRPNYGVYAIG